MNIYRGCLHGCIYCDSRSKCYNMQHDFEYIEVKENACELLERALRKKTRRCMLSTGSMCDPYLPIEKELKLTRSCLEIIDRHDFGVCLLTKSDLILRDLALIDKINQKTKAVVQMTLTTYDDDLCKIIEPNVTITSKRIEVLKRCQELKIPTVVWLSPFLPFINDGEENFINLLNACFDCGVKGIICFGIGLTLREGNREYYYRQLDKSFPGLKDKYQRIYGNQYEIRSANDNHLMKIFEEECKKRRIISRVDKCFEYLKEFPISQAQTSLF